MEHGRFGKTPWLAEIPCKVSKGMFSSEVSILVTFPNGEVMSGWFDKGYVRFEGELTKESEIDGRFRVEVIEEAKDSLLIRLGDTGHQILQGSPRVRVPKNFLLPQSESAQPA